MQMPYSINREAPVSLAQRRGITLKKLAAEAYMARTTLYDKLACRSEFTLGEVQRIIAILGDEAKAAFHI